MYKDNCQVCFKEMDHDRLVKVTDYMGRYEKLACPSCAKGYKERTRIEDELRDSGTLMSRGEVEGLKAKGDSLMGGFRVDRLVDRIRRGW